MSAGDATDRQSESVPAAAIAVVRKLLWIVRVLCMIPCSPSPDLTCDCLPGAVVVLARSLLAFLLAGLNGLGRSFFLFKAGACEAVGQGHLQLRRAVSG